MKPSYDHGVQLLRQQPGMLSHIARELGLVPHAVSQWSHVPARHVVRVEEITGIPREYLRPDLYRGMDRRRA